MFTLSLILLLTRCNSVDFDAPLPSDQISADKMDPDFLGKYYYIDSVMGKKGKEQFFNAKYFSTAVGDQDSIILFSTEVLVTDKIVSYSLDFTAFYKIDKVDTARLNRSFKSKDVYVRDHYLIHTENFTDTLLDLNGKDKLFLYKSRYYLNHLKTGNSKREKENSWSICQFEKLNHSLFSLNVTNELDYTLLFDTSKTWRPIFPIAHLSNKGFKSFVDKGGFRQKYRLLKYAN